MLSTTHKLLALIAAMIITTIHGHQSGEWRAATELAEQAEQPIEQQDEQRRKTEEIKIMNELLAFAGSIEKDSSSLFALRRATVSVNERERFYARTALRWALTENPHGFTDPRNRVIVADILVGQLFIWSEKYDEEDLFNSIVTIRGAGLADREDAKKRMLFIAIMRRIIESNMQPSWPWDTSNRL